MAPCKCLGKTSVVLLLSAALLVIAACTSVSAATTNTGNVVSANADTRTSLRVTKYYDDLPAQKTAQVREGSVLGVKDVTIVPYCSAAGDKVVDRSTGVNVECKQEDIINDAKVGILKTLVDAAVKLHSDRLSVLKPDAQIKYPDGYDNLCTSFAVRKHKEPVSGTDFLLFVAGAPMTAGETQAWGTWCGSTTQTTRPVAGAVNVAPKYITKSSAALTRLVAREILVALGFGYYSNGITYMTRVTVRETAAVPVAKAPIALQMAQAHFGCNDMKYMELEYTEGDKIVLPYWRGRVMKDDLMALNQTAGYYTIMTLAAMADLGFYAVDYKKAEGMPWGRNWGCDFINKKCVNSDTSIVESVFCTEKPDDIPTLKCTTDRYALGVCDLTTHKTDLPASFQYFDYEPTKGGAQFAMDYCPIIAPTGPSTLCSTGPNDGVPYFVFGEASRCLDINAVLQYDMKVKYKSVCAKVTCDDAKKTYSVAFNDDMEHDCIPGQTVPLPEKDQENINFNSFLKATCPPYNEVCRTAPDYPIPDPHHSSSSHHSSSKHHSSSSHHSSSKHHSSHHDSALTVGQSVWGVTLSLAMVLFMIM